MYRHSIGDTVVPLTDTQIRNAKPTAKAFKLSDCGGMEGVDAIPVRGSVDFIGVCGLMLPIDQ
jgi:hypothetical protein